MSGRARRAGTRLRSRVVAGCGAAALILGLVPAVAAVAEGFAGGTAGTAGAADEGMDLWRADEPVAPGVEVTSYQRLEPDKWLAAQALSVDLSKDVQVDYLSSGAVSEDATLSEMVATHDPGEGRATVAAVNGDFFDLGGTYTPLGPGIADGELVHSGSQGSRALGFGPDGGRILEVLFEGTLTLPGDSVPLTGYNAAEVPPGGIGVYTARWGSDSRVPVVDRSENAVEVTVQDGTVIGVAEGAREGPIAPGTTVLLGREEGAELLRSLESGDAVDVAYEPRTGDGSPLPRTAVGGRSLLVVDGEPQQHEDPDTITAPRTAVGFSRDGQQMYVLTVDGLQARSGGATLTELGVMMADLGAYHAIELDGGGSSTLLAREAGGTALVEWNHPSDGDQRDVPNGLAFTAPQGSGELTGLRVATETDPDRAPTADAVPVGHPDRVFPGMRRALSAAGYDETFGPAPATPGWQSDDPRVGEVSGDGVFTAGRPGTTQVTASQAGASAGLEMTVLGELARISPTTQRVGLAGTSSEGSFGVLGHDAAGNAAPLDPGDVTLDYDESMFTIEPDPDGGGFRVTVPSGDARGLDTVTVRAGGHTAELVITIGLGDIGLADFEDAADWTFSSARAEGSLAAEPEGFEGAGLRMTYDFTLDTATRAAYVTPAADIPVTGQPQSFTLWIRGDGHGAWPSLHLRDAQGIDLVLRGDLVTWEDWSQVVFEVPEGTSYPVSVHRFYLAETRATESYTGEVVIDELRAQIPPAGQLPDTPPLPDPVLGTAGEAAGRDWRFAVVSDAQFVAREPDSDAVARARRTLREVRAADPDFVVINGDWVDEGSPADLAFAREMIEEELGDLPWYYVPGNHEVMGGDIDDFVAEFGDTQLTFDHGGTRFVTLDTSSLTIRGGGYEQFVELREQLDAAAADPSIGSVVVMGHVPPRDTTPQAASQLTDRWEATLVETWLADFRRETGKGVAYLGAHVGIFDAYHLDGVPYVIGGNAGKGPAAAANEGGFTGWMMVGVDQVSPAEQADARQAPHRVLPDWLTVRTRPHVDGLTLRAPTELAVGEAATAGATLVQDDADGAREVPVAFPVSADWSGSNGLFIGPADEAGGEHVAAFDPVVGELTGLAAGTVTLAVEVSGVRQETTVRVSP